MDEDIIADFKQFITATLSQQTSDLRGDLDVVKIDISDIRKDIKKLDEKLCGMIDEVDFKVDTILTAVGERFEENTVKTTTQLDDHEIRITKLEHNPA